MSALGLASTAGERSEPRPDGRGDARAREPDTRAGPATTPAQGGREATPADFRVPRPRNEPEA
jgi:hypothetical protein